MMYRLTGAALLMSAIVACSGGEEEATVVADLETDTAAMAMETGTPSAVQCAPMTQNMALEGRQSPYDSTMIDIGGETAKVCYGRPSMRDRQIFGELVAYDTLWRTGANEPTTIHLPFPATIAGLEVEPGSYSIYTVPGQNEWQVIVNRSTSQWGIESAYSPEVRSQEVGRAAVPATSTAEPVEQFTIESQPAGPNGANLVISWENTQVTVPIQRS